MSRPNGLDENPFMLGLKTHSWCLTACLMSLTAETVLLALLTGGLLGLAWGLLLGRLRAILVSLILRY
jgi:hypothetical protein